MFRFSKRRPEGSISGRILLSFGKTFLFPLGFLPSIVLAIPGTVQAYMPRYVHVTLGVPWVAYLVFLLGVLSPVFLYLGIAWYWRHELEGSPGRKEDGDEE